MNTESKKTGKKPQAARQAAHPKERETFKSLLLTNPNYFGNLAESPLTPVLGLSGNTSYEELACVGYHPQQEYLEGVVYIYQPTGYGTDICGPGTPEYVRFYLSFDGGATWQSVVKDWNVSRTGDEPKEFWSQSMCWGAITLPRSG